MANEKDYIIEECRYCGNKTKLDIVGKYTEYGDPTELDWEMNWLLLKCSVCGKISFSSLYSGEDSKIYNNDGSFDYEKFYTTLYPIETYQEINVPEKVKKAFSSALKVYHIDKNICMIALRRTLEIICNDKGANGINLEKKIIDLSQKGIFPKPINEASDILRLIGNEAAHGDDINYNEQIIKEMINFTQIIIEYVYVIPYKIQNIKINTNKI